MPENENKNDHDLLIEIKTTLGFVLAELREVKDNSYRRIDNLEREKISRDEVAKLKSDADIIHKELGDDIGEIKIFISNLKGKWAIIGTFIGLATSFTMSLIVKLA